MDEVMKLVSKGVKELIVIGQDTTYYGLDLYGRRELGSLLTSLASVKDLEWVPADVRVSGKISSRHPPRFSGKSENLPVSRHADSACFR